MHTENIIEILVLCGVIASAISGATVAVSKHTDPFGVIVLGVITATGGGITRDILLGALPPKIFLDYSYVLIAAAAALIVYFSAWLGKDYYQKNTELLDKINNIFDAIGLGSFVVAGSQAAIDYGYLGNGFLIILIGVITGIGGGFLRDIMVKEIPFVLNKRIYALAAVCGGTVFYILYTSDMHYAVCAFSGVLTTFAIRMLATHFRWDLPPAY